jgi:hypothetical protein
LDENFNCFVSIEAQFVNKILRNYGQSLNESEFEQFQIDLFSEEKFKNWKLDKSALEKEFSELTLPVSISTIFNLIFEKETSGSSFDFFVLKSGKNIRFYSKLINEFPDSKFIFIRRDPRGIFNSMNKAIDSRTGKIMKEDILGFCVQYLMMNRLIDQIKNSPNLLIVDYEKLLTNEDQIINELSVFLNSKITESESNYHLRIPDKQKHLHNNVAKTASEDRITAWKKELNPKEISIIQALLKKEMNERNYQILNIFDLSFIDKMKYKFSFRIALVRKIGSIMKFKSF